MISTEQLEQIKENIINMKYYYQNNKINKVFDFDGLISFVNELVQQSKKNDKKQQNV